MYSRVSTLKCSLSDSYANIVHSLELDDQAWTHFKGASALAYLIMINKNLQNSF